MPALQQALQGCRIPAQAHPRKAPRGCSGQALARGSSNPIDRLGLRLRLLFISLSSLGPLLQQLRSRPSSSCPRSKLSRVRRRFVLGLRRAMDQPGLRPGRLDVHGSGPRFKGGGHRLHSWLRGLPELGGRLQPSLPTEQWAHRRSEPRSGTGRGSCWWRGRPAQRRWRRWQRIWDGSRKHRWPRGRAQPPRPDRTGRTSTATPGQDRHVHRSSSGRQGGPEGGERRPQLHRHR